MSKDKVSVKLSVEIADMILTKVMMAFITDMAEKTKENGCLSFIIPRDKKIAEEAIDDFVKTAQRELN